jgi:hypothetical protein
MIAMQTHIDTISTIPRRLAVACYNRAASHVMGGNRLPWATLSGNLLRGDWDTDDLP